MDIRTLVLPDGVIDLAKREVVRGDVTARLSSTETRLLGYLAARPNEDVSREALLVDVWGYAPGAATRTIDTTIRRLRKKIESDPSAPRVVLTVQGRGYRLAVLETDAPAPSPVQGGRLAYFGRQQEVAQIREAVGQSGSLVSVLGPGGIGKSRAVDEAIEPLCGGHSIVRVDLADISGDEGLSYRVALAMGLPASATDDPGDQIRSVLALNPVILVLDAFEHWVSQAETVEGWLSTESIGCVVITSRIGVSLSDQTEIRLDPLSVSSAVEMFVDRASRVRPDFAEHATGDVLPQIVELLDRIPLAIELAAPLTRMCDAREMLRRLADQTGFIRGHSAGMSAVFQWSWSLLDDREAQALATATVFRGGFNHAAASAVLNLDMDQVKDALHSLVNQSLLRQSGSEGGARFGLYDTIRQHAAHHLASGDADAAEARHAAHYLAWADSADVEVVNGCPEAVLRTLAERDNLLRVTETGDVSQRLAATVYLTQAETARGLGQADLGRLRARLAAYESAGEPIDHELSQSAQLLIGRTFHVLGRRSDAEAVFDRLAVTEGVSPRIALRARATAASLQVLRGALEDAERESRAVLETAERDGLYDAAYAALESLCLLHRARADRDQLEVCAQQLIACTEERGHSLWQPTAHMYLGTNAVWNNDLDGIRDHFSAAAEQDEMMGITSRTALARAFGGSSLAQLADNEETLDEASRWLDDAERVERSVGRRVANNVLLMGRSRVAVARGDFDVARSTLQRSLRQARAREHGPWIGIMSMLLASVAVLEGDLYDASDVLEEAIALCKVPTMAAPLAAFRAGVAAASGDLAAAEAAWAGWGDIGDSPRVAAQISLYRGHLEIARGDLAAAEACAAAFETRGLAPVLVLRVAHRWLLEQLEAARP